MDQLVENPSAMQETAYNAGDAVLIGGSGGSSGKGNDNQLQYSCLGKSHERWNLGNYSPWGRRVRHNLTKAPLISLFKVNQDEDYCPCGPNLVRGAL